MGLFQRSHKKGTDAAQIKPIKKNNKFIMANIQGLYTKTKPYKVARMKEIALENEAILISLTESHLNDNILDAEIKIPGFQIFRSDRPSNIQKGGIILYIRDDISASTKLISSGSINLIEYLMLFIEKLNVVIITIYRSPQSNVNSFQTVIENIEK